VFAVSTTQLLEPLSWASNQLEPYEIRLMDVFLYKINGAANAKRQ